MTSHKPETDRKKGALSPQWQMLAGFVPPEGIGLVLGVDRFLDMCRTSLNVTGDLVAATVIAAGEEDGRERVAA